MSFAICFSGGRAFLTFLDGSHIQQCKNSVRLIIFTDPRVLDVILPVFMSTKEVLSSAASSGPSCFASNRLAEASFTLPPSLTLDIQLGYHDRPKRHNPSTQSTAPRHRQATLEDPEVPL